MSPREAVKGGSSECNDSDEDREEVAADQLGGEVKLGDLIWVKVGKDAWWPAQVVDKNTLSKSKKPGNTSMADVLVRLYGSYQYLYVDPIKCHSEFQIILEQNDGSYGEIFNKALELDRPSLKSGRSKVQGSKPTGSVRADASKKKLNKSRVEQKQETEASKFSAQETQVNRKLRSNSRSTEKEEKSKTHKQDGVQKRVKPNDRSDEIGRGSKIPKQVEVLKNAKTAEQTKKIKVPKQDDAVKSNSLNSEGKKIRTHKQDEMLNIDNLNSPGSELSARRLRVMQNLGLSAPSGSPFDKNGHIA